MSNSTYALLLSSLMLVACGGTEEPQPTRCEIETRDIDYVPGMVAAGNDGVFEIELIEAVPAPPDKGDNAWSIELRDIASAAPVSGAAVDVVPFMPDHGHGTSIIPVITEGAEPGHYQIDVINLWMPGFWEVRFDIDIDTGSDLVVFPICVEG